MISKELIKEYITPLSPISTSLSRQGKIDHNVKCVLFDIYGTLFISNSGDIGSTDKNIKKHRNIADLIQKYKISKKAGQLLDELYSAIRNDHVESKKKGILYPEVNIVSIWQSVLPNLAEEKIKRFAVEYEMIVNPVFPMPNAAKILAVCAENGIKMGIISNAQFYTPYLFQWFFESNLDQLGFSRELVLLSYEFGCAKPSLKLFEAAATKLKTMGIQENAVIYIGNDMLKDVYPAKATGFISALFAGDERSLRLRKDHPVCRHLEADLTITDLSQLESLICQF